ncbi:MAG: immunoglobulin domain-containing protein [Myxococcota bacterium]
MPRAIRFLMLLGSLALWLGGCSDGAVTESPPSFGVILPDPHVVDEGGDESFWVDPIHADTLQWQRNEQGAAGWTDIAGATGDEYVVKGATMDDDGDAFRCIAKNAAGSATSLPEQLTVTRALPKILQTPADQSVQEGAPVAFSVTATGSGGLTYAWQRSDDDGATWQPVPLATDATLTLAAATLDDDGARFRVAVTNPAGTTTSQPAKLTVAQLPPTISASPQGQTVPEGSDAVFSVTAKGSGDLAYLWQRSDDDGATWEDVDVAAEAMLTLTAVQWADDGAQFRCRVTNSAGEATSDASTLHVTVDLVEITAQPQDQAVDEGQPALFALTATGSGIPTYQWQRSDDAGKSWGDVAGAGEPSYALAAATMEDDAARLRCVVTNPAGGVTSGEAKLTVKRLPPKIALQPQSQSVQKLAPAKFSVTATGSGGLKYRWLRSDGVGKPWGDIPGADQSSYTVASATLADDGAKFRVVVTNPAGSVTSSVALLTIAKSPILIDNQPEDAAAPSGRSVLFAVSASGPLPLAYQWQRSNDAGETWTDVANAKANTHSLTVQDADDGALFRCQIADTGETMFSAVAHLTVLPVIDKAPAFTTGLRTAVKNAAGWHMVWGRPTDTVDTLHYAQSSDGAHWSLPVAIASQDHTGQGDNHGMVNGQALAADAKGNLHVVYDYRAGQSADPPVLASYLTKVDGVWDETQAFLTANALQASPTAFLFDPMLWPGPQGTLHLVARDAAWSSTSYHLIDATLSAGTWQVPTALVTVTTAVDADSLQGSLLEGDASGNAWVLYYNRSNGVLAAKAFDKADGSWSAPAVVHATQFTTTGAGPFGIHASGLVRNGALEAVVTLYDKKGADTLSQTLYVTNAGGVWTATPVELGFAATSITDVHLSAAGSKLRLFLGASGTTVYTVDVTGGVIGKSQTLRAVGGTATLQLVTTTREDPTAILLESVGGTSWLYAMRVP